MGKYYEVKDKSAEEILEEMTNLEGNIGAPKNLLEVQRAAIEVKIVDRICTTIDALRHSNNRTSTALNILTGVLILVGLLQVYLAYYAK
jgi:hypothetical protein